MGKIILRNIEGERVRHGLSRNEVSTELGITPKTYWNWIHGVTEIPSGKLIQMSRMWKKSVDFLLEIYEDETS
ncbi:helix-turn-helix domain-containing protein [Candidatus Micrarchaeota archaeon]|nr:helix-turn-helix domain-containing protein [Candidatus Micrarchaeota archaeon]